MNIEHFSLSRWEGGKNIFFWKLLKRAAHSKFNLFHEQHYYFALYVSIIGWAQVQPDYPYLVWPSL